jgi:hypothetical protein
MWYRSCAILIVMASVMSSQARSEELHDKWLKYYNGEWTWKATDGNTYAKLAAGDRSPMQNHPAFCIGGTYMHRFSSTYIASPAAKNGAASSHAHGDALPTTDGTTGYVEELIPGRDR